MSETKGATRQKPPSKRQRTKAEMEEVIVIDATLTSSRARCWQAVAAQQGAHDANGLRVIRC